MAAAWKYKVLDLQPGADATAIRAAFRTKALKLHPDKGGCASEFQKLVDAYEELSKLHKNVSDPVRKTTSTFGTPTKPPGFIPGRSTAAQAPRASPWKIDNKFQFRPRSQAGRVPTPKVSGFPSDVKNQPKTGTYPEETNNATGASAAKATSGLNPAEPISGSSAGLCQSPPNANTEKQAETGASKEIPGPYKESMGASSSTVLPPRPPVFPVPTIKPIIRPKIVEGPVTAITVPSSEQIKKLQEKRDEWLERLREYAQGVKADKRREIVTSAPQKVQAALFHHMKNFHDKDKLKSSPIDLAKRQAKPVKKGQPINQAKFTDGEKINKKFNYLLDPGRSNTGMKWLHKNRDGNYVFKIQLHGISIAHCTKDLEQATNVSIVLHEVCRRATENHKKAICEAEASAEGDENEGPGEKQTLFDDSDDDVPLFDLEEKLKKEESDEPPTKKQRLDHIEDMQMSPSAERDVKSIKEQIEANYHLLSALNSVVEEFEIPLNSLNLTIKAIINTSNLMDRSHMELPKLKTLEETVEQRRKALEARDLGWKDFRLVVSDIFLNRTDVQKKKTEDEILEKLNLSRTNYLEKQAQGAIKKVEEYINLIEAMQAKQEGKR